MQVIFIKWHMITLDVIPSLIDIFLQKEITMALFSPYRLFNTSTLLGNICIDYKIDVETPKITHSPLPILL